MPLVIAGIDEAGYGPTLGPLCVGLAVFRVHGWSPGDEAPDLWDSLKDGVCVHPKDALSRVAIADSKALKRPNDGPGHPLLHLERGVLAMLRAIGASPARDAELFDLLGVRLEDRPWCQGSAPLPAAWSAAQLSIAGNLVAGAMERAGVELLDARCEAIGVDELNAIIRETGSKGDATLRAIGRHLRHLLARHPDADLRVVCDRLGGRLHYAEALAVESTREFEPIEESPGRSRYMCGRVGVQFQPEAESAHLPVALASMLAKYVRELAMGRFNRYWGGRCVELKPTAGYAADARRWLREVGATISSVEREALVRRA